jgi:mannose-6-phosphate isomerase
LSKFYNFDLSNIGEIWGISAHEKQSNFITNSIFSGMTFREFYKSHRNYFGYYASDEFPLLFKLIEAEGDLSIQVHPSDNYASKFENSYGKDECWYILDTKKDSRIQIGHKAKNREELYQSILNKNLDSFLQYHKIVKGDYYYIPSGKVHSICKHTTLLEVSQSSDITYRLYDYNRLDNGVLRELHIDKSLDVISFPDTVNQRSHHDKYFSFKILEVINQKIVSHINGDYIYVIEGKGYFNDEIVSSGDFIVITSNCEYSIVGKMKIALIRITN